MDVVRSFSDLELINSIRSAENLDEPIRFLYREYFSYLSWYVLNNKGEKQDSEDIFQEVIVEFIDIVKENKFRQESSIKTFLYSLNRHFWLNELKKRGRALAREQNYEKQRESEDMSLMDYGKDREAKAQMMSLLDRLGENCKKILLLFYYENLSISEILKSLNYQTEQVVRNKKYKCLKEIERMIATSPNLKQTLKTLLNG